MRKQSRHGFRAAQFLLRSGCPRSWRQAAPNDVPDELLLPWKAARIGTVFAPHHSTVSPRWRRYRLHRRRSSGIRPAASAPVRTSDRLACPCSSKVAPLSPLLVSFHCAGSADLPSHRRRFAPGPRPTSSAPAATEAVILPPVPLNCSAILTRFCCSLGRAAAPFLSLLLSSAMARRMAVSVTRPGRNRRCPRTFIWSRSLCILRHRSPRSATSSPYPAPNFPSMHTASSGRNEPRDDPRLCNR